MSAMVGIAILESDRISRWFGRPPGFDRRNLFWACRLGGRAAAPGPRMGLAGGVARS